MLPVGASQWRHGRHAQARRTPAGGQGLALLHWAPCRLPPSFHPLQAPPASKPAAPLGQRGSQEATWQVCHLH